MDLLYSNNVDAFALMTSDSDFTPLVLRILESGLPVYGFGANMGQVASYISNNNSSFSSINYGYRKISDLIKATELFKVEMRNGTAMYIRDSRS